MPLQCHVKEAFGGFQISSFAEPELNGVAIAVDGPVEIPLLPTNLDIGFINMPFAGDCSFALIEPLQQLR
jgi:hypothetical protein